MQNQDQTRLSQPEATQPSSAAFRLFEEFVHRREAGEEPEVADLLQRLPTDAERIELTGLVDDLLWTEDRLPVRLRPNLILDGRYRLVEVVGAGGMGQVWRSIDEKLGQVVAVKVLNLLSSPVLEGGQVIEREIALLRELDHPGIVKILDRGADGEHRFLVMNFVEGTPLNQCLDSLRARVGAGGGHRLGAADLLSAIDRPLAAGRTSVVSGESWYEACAKVMIEVLRTVEAAHARHIVHRDLKPANLILCGGANPMLLDFGLGGKLGAAAGDLTSSMFGTVAYIAPEQWRRGAMGNDPRTDVYQLGLILYELLTLQRTFPDSAPEAAPAIAKGLFRRPRQLDPRIPPSLEDVCLDAMELDPARRYPTAQEFRDDLGCFLRGDPVWAERRRFVIPTRRVRYFVRRHRRVMATAALVMVTALVAPLVMRSPGLDVTWKEIGEAFEVVVHQPQRLFALALYGSDASGRPTHLRPVYLTQRVKPEGAPDFAEAHRFLYLNGEKAREDVHCEIPDYPEMVPLRLQVVAVFQTVREEDVLRLIREFDARTRDARPVEIDGYLGALWEKTKGTQAPLPRAVAKDRFIAPQGWSVSLGAAGSLSLARKK